MIHVRTVRPYELGLQLDIEESDLETVLVDHRNDISGQLRQVLSLYLRQTVEPSWSHVVTALYAIHEVKCAVEIEKWLGE